MWFKYVEVGNKQFNNFRQCIQELQVSHVSDGDTDEDTPSMYKDDESSEITIDNILLNASNC